MIELHIVLSYSSKLDCLCSSLKLRVDTFTNAGCDSADVANYCISSSPSSSLSRVGERDRCAYLVGQQCSSLSGKPDMDCAFSNRFSWVFMGCEVPDSRYSQNCGGIIDDWTHGFD